MALTKPNAVGVVCTIADDTEGKMSLKHRRRVAGGGVAVGVSVDRTRIKVVWHGTITVQTCRRELLKFLLTDGTWINASKIASIHDERLHHARVR